MPNGARRLEEGFQRWFKDHMMRQLREEPEDVDKELFALACGPDVRVRTYSACVVDGVRFVTADREKGRKTQNCGVMAEGHHKDRPRDFYGVLKEIKVLYFNSDVDHQQSVVLFNCDWFWLDGLKILLEVYDKLFRSINLGNQGVLCARHKAWQKLVCRSKI